MDMNKSLTNLGAEMKALHINLDAKLKDLSSKIDSNKKSSSLEKLVTVITSLVAGWWIVAVYIDTTYGNQLWKQKFDLCGEAIGTMGEMLASLGHPNDSLHTQYDAAYKKLGEILNGKRFTTYGASDAQATVDKFLTTSLKPGVAVSYKEDLEIDNELRKIQSAFSEKCLRPPSLWELLKKPLPF